MKKSLIITTLLSCLFIQGCETLAVVGVAGTVNAVTDRRTLGTQLDDSTTAITIEKRLSNIPDISASSHINVHIYNGSVLLTGQSPDNTLISQAEKVAREHKNVSKVHNQIRTAKPTPTTTRAHDLWVESAIKGRLLATKEVNVLHVKVIVEDSEVFLMGMLTKEESEKVVDVVRKTDGVQRVVKVFEYI